MKPNALVLCSTMSNHPGTFSYLHCFIFETLIESLSLYLAKLELWHVLYRRIPRAAEGDGNGRRRRDGNGVSHKRLFFTIAITGIAVLIGSLFFQRKPE